jgi:hypothetical protein
MYGRIKRVIVLALVAGLIGAVGAVAGPAQATGPALALSVGPPQPVYGSGLLQAIACTSGTSCVAVGAASGAGPSGNVISVINGVPGTPETAPYPADILYGIACPSTTSCLAVGNTSSYEGVLVTITSGIPTATAVVPNAFALSDIACVSASLCYAVGLGFSSAIVVPINSGVAGAPIAVPGASILWGVGCAGGVCQAVGHRSVSTDSLNPTSVGVVARILNGGVGPARGVPGTEELHAVTCRDASQCVAVGAAPLRALCLAARGCTLGVYTDIHGLAISPARVVPGTSDLRGVDCPSGASLLTPCIAVGQDFGRAASVVVGVGGLLPGLRKQFTPVQKFNGISCAGGATCEAAGNFYFGFPGAVASVAFAPLIP